VVAHLDERVHGSGLGGGMKSWRVQVRAGGACNAHAMHGCRRLDFQELVVMLRGIYA